MQSTARPIPPAPRDPDCYWVEPGRLLAGEYPGSLEPGRTLLKVQALLQAGVTLFLDLTREGELDPYASLVTPEAAARGREARCLRSSIGDVSVPSLAGMMRILDAIDAEIATGGTVYVHCWGGIGRTGTVVGCWLVRHRGLSGEAALRALRELRRGIRKEGRRSPETDQQDDFVRGWVVGT